MKEDTKLTSCSNACIFPIVWFFYPETRYRSLEEMDDIFKKSSNVFNVVPISLKEPHRYDKHGNLKVEYIEEIEQHDSTSEPKPNERWETSS